MNLEQQIFYADTVLSKDELQTNVIFEQGQLIPQFCSVQCEITWSNAVNEIPEIKSAADDVAWLDFTQADAAHGSQVQFFVNKSIPLFPLQNVLLTLDNNVIINTQEIRGLQQQAYNNKYRQQQLIMQRCISAQHRTDMCDVIKLDKSVVGKLVFSVRLTDLLPYVFQDKIFNIRQQMTLQLNFKDMEKLFWISNLGGTRENVLQQTLNFLDYYTNQQAYAAGVMLRRMNPQLTLKFNCLYHKVSIPQQLSTVSQTIAIIEKKTKIQTSIKLSDALTSTIQVISLLNQNNASPYDINIIDQDTIKNDNSVVAIYRNNNQIFNPQQSSAYNDQDNTGIFVQYLKKMLAFQQPNNNTITKSVGQVSHNNYSNTLVQFRTNLSTDNDTTTTKICFYVNYLDQNLSII